MRPNSKTKILYLITKSSWGGAQRYVYDLATTIDAERFDPVVAVGGEGALYDKLKDAGIKTISIRGLSRDVSLIKDFLAGLHIAYLLFRERPEVLHINSSKVGLLGAVLGRLFFINHIIFTCHGWAFNEDRPTWQKVILKFLQWLTVLCSHTTIAVSTAVKQQLDWPRAQKKMAVVHLGREVATLKDKEDARGVLSMKVTNTKTSLYEHRQDVWIGTVAELHPTKCIHIAIEALARLINEFPALRYVIIHDGQERGRLEQLVRNLNLEDHVFFTGTVEQAATLLKAFDIFVLPSRSEAFGYVLLEAGLAGVPVIATDVGGIPDIITHEQNGLLVPPENVDALADAIKKLLSDQILNKKLTEQHSERAQTFTLSAMVTKTEALYQR